MTAALLTGANNVVKSISSQTTQPYTIAIPTNTTDNEMVLGITADKNSGNTETFSNFTGDMVANAPLAVQPVRTYLASYLQVPVGASKPANTTVGSNSGTSRYATMLIRCQGAVTGNPLDSVGSQAAQAGVTALDLPSFASTTDNALLVAAFIINVGGLTVPTFTGPVGMTLVDTITVQDASATMILAVYQQALGAAGSTGTRGISNLSLSSGVNGFMFTLKSLSVPKPTAVIGVGSTMTGYTFQGDATGSSAVNPATVASYDWDWGDGTTHGTGVNGPTARHRYTLPGLYTVKLKVIDSNGVTSDTVQTLVQTVEPTAEPQILAVTSGASWAATPNTSSSESVINDLLQNTFIHTDAQSIPTNVPLVVRCRPCARPGNGLTLAISMEVDRIASSSGTFQVQLLDFDGNVKATQTGVVVRNRDDTSDGSPVGTGDINAGTIMRTALAVFNQAAWSTLTDSDFDALSFAFSFSAA